jgi:hypothetical protein
LYVVVVIVIVNQQQKMLELRRSIMPNYRKYSI